MPLSSVHSYTRQIASKLLLTTVSWYTDWQMTMTLMYQLIESSNNEGPKQLKWGHVTWVCKGSYFLYLICHPYTMF